jgi:hypothetical protein
VALLLVILDVVASGILKVGFKDVGWWLSTQVYDLGCIVMVGKVGCEDCGVE